MANIVIPNLDYTYNGKESTEIILKESIKVPLLSDRFTMKTDVRSKEQMNIATQIEEMLKPYGGCDDSGRFTSAENTITNRTLEVEPVEIAFKQCEDAFEGSIFETIARTGTDINDLSGTGLQKIIDMMVANTAATDIYRQVIFGDKNSSEDAYRSIDGMVKLMLEDQYCVPTYEVFGTGALGTDAAYNQLVTMFAEMPLHLYGKIRDNNTYIDVTRSVHQNLWATYAGNSNAGRSTGELTYLSETKQLTFQGVPIRENIALDDALTKAKNPYFGTMKHMIIIAYKPNWFFGADESDPRNRYRVWFFPNDLHMYYYMRTKIGVQFAHCDFQMFAY